MRKYLISADGKFYKANLHVHTDVSDGRVTPEEVKEAYKSHGYSVVAYTDHEVFVPHNDLSDSDFLAINSVEVAINNNFPGGFKYNKTFHINLYAKSPDKKDCCVCTASSVFVEGSKKYISEFAAANPYKKHYSTAAINDLIKRANDDGFLVCLNHPVWSLQNYTDYSGLKGLWGIEVYNTASAKSGYVDTVMPFEDLLREGESLVAVAADDAHRINVAAFGGWTMIKSTELSYGAIMSALESGDCYSSTGPEINELYIEDGVIKVKTSAAVSILLTTDIRIAKSALGTADNPISEASFDINDYLTTATSDEVKPFASWIRLEVVDSSGNHAWTRSYSLGELIGINPEK